MKLRNLFLAGAVALLAIPSFGATYFGGLEDLGRGGDRDYNDAIFSLSGSSLLLKTTDGAWYSNPTPNMNGIPFWDNASWDGNKMNVGYCIYGGGNCGSGLAPNAQYLASKDDPASSAKNVYFSMGPGNVTSNLLLDISSATNTLYWYDYDNWSKIYKIGSGIGTYSFNPTNTFGIAAYNNLTHQIYYSSDCADPSQFAFFQPTPEPGTMGAMAGGLICLGTLFRRRKLSEQK